MVILGYALTFVISPLASWLVAHFTKDTTLGVTVGGGVSGVGGVILKRADPAATMLPTPKAP